MPGGGCSNALTVAAASGSVGTGPVGSVSRTMPASVAGVGLVAVVAVTAGEAAASESVELADPCLAGAFRGSGLFTAPLLSGSGGGALDDRFSARAVDFLVLDEGAFDSGIGDGLVFEAVGFDFTLGVAGGVVDVEAVSLEAAAGVACADFDCG
jgi:hypothetical protein